MDKTAGHMMGPMGLMDDDAKMLCKVLEISAAQALSLKKKIRMGRKLPSWAEYKIYKAGDALTSAMASTHSMRDHMPKITIAIKSGPSMGSVLPSNMSKQAMLGNSGFTQHQGAIMISLEKYAAKNSLKKRLVSRMMDKLAAPGQPPGMGIQHGRDIFSAGRNFGGTPPYVPKGARMPGGAGVPSTIRKPKPVTPKVIAPAIAPVAASIAKGVPSPDSTPPAKAKAAPRTPGTKKFKIPKDYTAPTTLKGADYKTRAMFIQHAGQDPRNRKSWDAGTKKLMNEWWKDRGDKKRAVVKDSAPAPKVVPKVVPKAAPKAAPKVTAKTPTITPAVQPQQGEGTVLRDAQPKPVAPRVEVESGPMNGPQEAARKPAFENLWEEYTKNRSIPAPMSREVTNENTNPFMRNVQQQAATVEAPKAVTPKAVEAPKAPIPVRRRPDIKGPAPRNRSN